MRENIESIRDKAIEFNVPYPWALKQKKNHSALLLRRYRERINEYKKLLLTSSGLGAELFSGAIKFWEKQFGIEKSYIEYLGTPERFRNKRITDRDIEAARARSLVEFLPEDYPGKGNIRCLFPGHNDKQASMQVFQDGLYCHTCGRQMNVIDLVMMERGMDFKGAVKYLAR